VNREGAAVQAERWARPSGRAADALRDIRITRGYTRHAEGSVLVEFGDTKVLCTASVSLTVQNPRSHAPPMFICCALTPCFISTVPISQLHTTVAPVRKPISTASPR